MSISDEAVEINEPVMMTVDVETTVDSDHPLGKANQYTGHNQLVALGGLFRYPTHNSKDIPEYGATYRYGDEVSKFQLNLPPLHYLHRMIGQNIKFDINWMRTAGMHLDGAKFEDVLPTLQIWDTQAAEYILTGQTHQFASLDQLAMKYDFPLKDDYIKEQWDNGVKTQDIDKPRLMNYLENDVRVTDGVAIKQMEQAVNENRLNLIEAMMDSILATAEMEYNGMHIDIIELLNVRDKLEEQLDKTKEELEHIVSKKHGPDILALINFNSNQHLSALIFGGDIKYKKRVRAGKYKNGKVKFKTEDAVHHITGALESYRGVTEPTSTPGYFKVGEEILDQLPSVAIVDNIKIIRKLNKLLGTYIYGLAELITPLDTCIHGTIHHTSTITSRTSSSKPNLQNMPSSEDSPIKNLFDSRWGDDGTIIEVDYKQLEVIALAFVTGDPQLREDILNGRDIHFETGKGVFGWSVPEDMGHDKRRIVKTINFGLIYGGKAPTLAAQAKCTRAIAQNCIDAFYNRYPGIKIWHNHMMKRAKNEGKYIGDTTKNGLPAKRWEYESPTGRKYVFKEYDAPAWLQSRGINTSFSPTEIANYPIQGFATGDIVPMMLGILYKVLKKDPHLAKNCLMINTIHDSILFDCKEEVVLHALDVIVGTLEATPQYLWEYFGIDFELPLKVDASCGPTWKNQTHEYKNGKLYFKDA